MIIDDFIITSGSIIGSHHRNIYKNNQDAISITQTEKGIVAIISDGCGSGKHSEVGAKLVSVFMSNYSLKLLEKINESDNKSIKKIFENFNIQIINFIKSIVNQIGDNLFVREFMLFTTMGVIITEKKTILFTLGDGVYILNNKVTILDNNNAPDYIGYNLIENSNNPSLIIQETIQTEDVNNIMLCSDGVSDILRNSTVILKDGYSVGGLNQFILDEIYIKNTLSLQKRLTFIGGFNNILRDDTSIILIKRKPIINLK